MVILASLLVAIESTLASADVTKNTWLSKAPMHQAREGLGVAVTNGKIYAIGGSTTTAQGSIIVDTTEEYDPQTDSWTYKASMPTPRMAFAVAVFQNKIFCIGGTTDYLYGYSNVNEVYDPATDSWATMAPAPTCRRGLQADVINDKIYIIGGLPNGTVNEVYDPTTNSWSIKASMPIDAGFASTVVDNKIYSVGSYYQSFELTSVTQIYNPHNDSWSTGASPLSSLNGGGASFAASTSGLMAPKRVYVFGESASVYSFSLQIYNPENDSWSFGADKPTICNYASCGVLNDKLYVVGGQVRNNTRDPYYMDTVPTAVNEQYTPSDYGAVSTDSSTLSFSESLFAGTVIVLVIAVALVIFYYKKRPRH